MKRLSRISGIVGSLSIVCAASGAFAQSTAAPQTPVARPSIPPRDNAPPPPVVATAIVRGRVTSATTGQPLYRVRITMNGAAANPPTAVTDSNGLFEVTGVPAGSYSMTAARAGYLTVQYGQRRPREPGRTLQVKNGDVVEQVNIALFDGAVLAGRVRDQTGEPIAGVRVEAMDMHYTRGHRLPLPAAWTTTNDLGEFRVGGLSPGTYYIKASTMEVWPDEDARKGTYAYSQTFYPGVVSTDNAERVSLATGQQVEDLDWSLVVGRAVRITGTLLSSKGEPIASQSVGLDRITRTVGGALYSASFGGQTRADQTGAFEFRDIPPGEYNLYSGSQQTEVAFITPLMVADSDVEHVVLTPLRPSSVRGTIITDEGAAPAFPAARVRILPLPTDTAIVLQAWGSPSPQAVGGDWSWRFGNIQGPHLFRPTGLPDDWMLSAVRLDGRDITDVPLDIPKGGAETSGLQMVLTQKAAKVSGDVVSPNGSLAADSTVIVFAADDRRWGLGTRFVKSARPDNTGRFSIGGLPTGTYLAIARDFVAHEAWEDPDYLRSLAPDASKIELREDAEQKVTLILKPEPQR